MATEYVKGLYAKTKHPNAPSFVVCKLSAKREALIEYLQSLTDEWVNMEVKEGKTKDNKPGLYVAIDTYKKPAAPSATKPEEETPDQEIPF